jgi:hypothetical protein
MTHKKGEFRRISLRRKQRRKSFLTFDKVIDHLVENLIRTSKVKVIRVG